MYPSVQGRSINPSYATGITLASLVLSYLLVVSLPGYAFPSALACLAILGIAVTWGAGPAVLATILASVLLNFYVVSPRLAWSFQGAGDVLGFAVVLLAGPGIGQLAYVAAQRLALRAALARLEALQAVDDAALAQLDQPALLRLLLARIRATLKADNAAVLLLDEAEHALIVGGAGAGGGADRAGARAGRPRRGGTYPTSGTAAGQAEHFSFVAGKAGTYAPAYT